jgi:hypothetical protein
MDQIEALRDLRTSCSESIHTINQWNRKGLLQLPLDDDPTVEQKVHSMNNVRLEYASGDGLSGTVWEFLLIRNRLVLDFYWEWRRQSRRHKQATVRRWDRMGGRQSTVSLAEVPFTEEIAARAKSEWLRGLQALVGVGVPQT